MSNFSRNANAGSNSNRRTSPYTLAGNSAPTYTHEGGNGFVRSTRQELFLQAINEMAEDTYYESASQRQARLALNVQKVVAEQGGWQWLCGFAAWLRNDAGMRSVAVMVAAEAVASADLRPSSEGWTPRMLIDSVCVRADEPAEVLGYWHTNHGRQIPAPVKRGVADAAARLYTERNALKYDGQSRDIRMADVIELVHPRPQGEQQSALFRFLLDRRHDREQANALLPLVSLDMELMSLPEGERLAAFESGATARAGWSWERVAGWLPGGLTASVWERLIPSMGYMALLRNLRNFDQAGISSEARKAVAERLSDPEAVAASRQFPYRFLSAWKATESLEWGSHLETALGYSVRNVPEFTGRNLVLIDTSGSMQTTVGGARSQAMRWEVAALFGAVVATRSESADLAIYATGVAPIQAPRSTTSILRFVEQMRGRIGSVGHGTNTWDAIRSQFNGHDRIIVLTDEQSHDHGTNPGAFMHFINLAGYQPATAPPDARTFTFGGFTDQMFTLLPLCERGATGRWPWE